MSSVIGSGSGGRGSESQDFELNLASIIDCFTVLIAFMLASAAFLSIGILDAGVAAAGASSAQSGTPPPINITVELKKDHQMAIKVSGKTSSSNTIHSKAEAWDYDALTQNLSALKSRWNDVSAVTLTADNDIPYRDVVKTMEIARKTLPAVLLGGF